MGGNNYKMMRIIKMNKTKINSNMTSSINKSNNQWFNSRIKTILNKISNNNNNKTTNNLSNPNNPHHKAHHQKTLINNHHQSTHHKLSLHLLYSNNQNNYNNNNNSRTHSTITTHKTNPVVYSKSIILCWGYRISSKTKRRNNRKKIMRPIKITNMKITITKRI